MSATVPPSVDHPDGVDPTSPIERRDSVINVAAPTPPMAQQRAGPTVIALILIALGLVFLAGNLYHIGGGALFLGLAMAFVVARVVTGVYGFAAPAGVLLGFGGFISLDEAGLLPGDSGGAFFIALGLGFVAVYLLGMRPTIIWPLFPAAALIIFGSIVYGGAWAQLVGPLSWLGSAWPLLLVGIGLWLLVRDRVPATLRTPLAVVGAVLLLLYGAVVLATAAAQASWQIGGVWPGAIWSGARGGNLSSSETVTLTGALAPDATLRVNNPNGHTRIGPAASGNEVRVVATMRYATSRPEAVLRPEGAGLALETRLPTAIGAGAVIDYVIEAPASATIDASSASGAIEVHGIAGPVQAFSASGDVILTDLGGPAQARSVSGAIRLTNIRGALTASTTSGAIVGTGLLAPREATTISGAIDLSGRFAEPARIASTSGDVDLRLAPTSATYVDITTVSGAIRSTTDKLAIQTQDRRHLTGAYGAGANTLTVRNVSGSVTLSDAT